MIRTLNLSEAGTLLEKRGLRLQEAERIAGPIIEDVRKRGDEALLEYARRFDGLDSSDVRVPAAKSELAPGFLAALETASKNIREFARTQLPKSKIRRLPDGRRLGQIVRPLESMGAYIPAGRYPLPSTLLMTVVPAQVAGVRTISMASPRPSAEILGTAAFLDVSNIYRMGGAHAIAALAFGTQTVAKVDRIVGPGNIYVAAAKKLLAGEVGIDFVAGPTEILIIVEETGDQCRQRVHRPIQSRGRGRLCFRPESRPANPGRRPAARRPLRCRFRQGDFRAGTDTRSAVRACAGDHNAGPRRRFGGARTICRGANRL
jgi:histidinol dehydrogenase